MKKVSKFPTCQSNPALPYLSHTIIISYNDFGHDCDLRCVYLPICNYTLCMLFTKQCTDITFEVAFQSFKHGNDSREDVDHKFGIEFEIISFIIHQSLPAHRDFLSLKTL